MPFSVINNLETINSKVLLDLSVIVPVYNEVANIPILYEELQSVLSNIGQRYEIIFVDDGSDDGSIEEMEKVCKSGGCVKIIKFSRKFGQTAALSAGFRYAQGEVVVCLDGDLQNDPRDIPKLIEKMAEGYDLVSGWRKHRKDVFLKRILPSKIANRMINWLISGTGVQLHDYGCTLKAYKRGVIKNINLYGEMHRFVPVFAAWIGAKIAEIPVSHRPRIHGKTKYNLSRVTSVVFDLVVIRFFSDYLTKPIQFFGKIAKLIFKLGLILILILAAIISFLDVSFLSFHDLFIIGALLVFSCLQIVLMGLLSEINIRSYFEGQKKAYYVVEKIYTSFGN